VAKLQAAEAVRVAQVLAARPGAAGAAAKPAADHDHESKPPASLSDSIAKGRALQQGQQQQQQQQQHGVANGTPIK
jgi:hypothetical protein